MNKTQRNIVIGVVGALAAVALFLLVQGWQAPDRVYYMQSARGDRPPVETYYRLVGPQITVGRKADVSTMGTYTAEVAVVVRQVDRGGERPGWTVTRSPEATLPISVGSQDLTGTREISDGDVILIGKDTEVRFGEGPSGLGAVLDWWESNPITHLFFSPKIIRAALPVVMRAFPVSLSFGAIAFFLAIPVGLIFAFMKMAPTPLFRWPATGYIDVVRGTPLFLQILIVFFGLPLMPFYRSIILANPWLNEPGFLGLSTSIWIRGLFVLTFNSSAYLAEIFRAGIQSIPRGQMEAARSLGMTGPQAMAYVIIPQTVRRILPTGMSEFILLFKDTALLAAVGVAEMALRSREVAATTYNASAYVLAASFYLLVTIPLGRIVANLEGRLAASEGGGAARGPSKPKTEIPRMESATEEPA